MKFDPTTHHRRSIRLRGHDYTLSGAYFVTPVTHARECLLGEVVEGEMRLNPCGKLVTACWAQLPEHFRNMELDEFVVMPNHLHGVVVIVREPARRGEALVALLCNARCFATFNPCTAWDGTAFVECHRAKFQIGCLAPNPQERFVGEPPNLAAELLRTHVRSDRELEQIRIYISDNPANWMRDEEYVK